MTTEGKDRKRDTKGKIYKQFSNILERGAEEIILH
jgi:hypothetical protein